LNLLEQSLRELASGILSKIYRAPPERYGHSSVANPLLR
jgi:hypothetical protein